ncbi:F-box/LRR-repeat protein 7 [Trichoplax sp. H2]|nr:F-box/LRR-repeat protein 7 [Trichoplax sp. H2]|eukprot:RDD47381.1 F-box/LRR-repeat protein 7 [Trichoplax sp. H2]
MSQLTFVSKTVLQDLPDDVLLSIFTYFSHGELCQIIGCVCRHWHSLSRDPCLWKHINLSNYSHSMTYQAIKTACHYFRTAYSLKLPCYDCFKDDNLVSIVRFCPTLYKIDCSFCVAITCQAIVSLVDCCPNLIDINLEGSNIKDRAVQVMSKLKLRSINLSHCTRLTDESLYLLGNGYSYLEIVNLDGIEFNQSAVIYFIALCKDRIKSICIDGANLSDFALEFISHCKLLHKLDISFCDQMTSAALYHLRALKDLRSLRLKKGHNFTNDALNDLFNYVILTRNIHWSCHITLLDLTECSQLDNNGLHSIAANCPQLKELNLSWCWNISDTGVDYILRMCRLLVSVILIGLHQITCNNLVDAPSFWKYLKFLNLTCCNSVKDSVVKELARNMKNLLIIDYYGERIDLMQP